MSAKPKAKVRTRKIRLTSQPEPRLYFAYGSNLALAQFKRRCPNAKRFGKLTIPDYRLVFRGVADIEPYRGCSVQGAVYKISPRCEEALDRYEGFPHLYRKSFLTVSVRLAEGEERQVLPLMFYQMNNDRIGTPASGYAGTIAQGYKDWGLDPQGLVEAIEHARQCEIADAMNDDDELEEDGEDEEIERRLDTGRYGQARLDLRPRSRAFRR